ncbi:hypothetical protein DMENIID0001_132860 [Sergentomyia squamirostris]
MHKCAIAFVIILFSISITLTDARELPDSPCPEIFRYRYNSTSRQWYGWGQIKNQNITDVRSFELYVKLVLNVPQDTKFNDEGKIEILKMDKTLGSLEFTVHFPTQSPLPEIHKIIFNDATLCETLSTINPRWESIRMRLVFKPQAANDNDNNDSQEDHVECGTLHRLVNSTPLVAGGEAVDRGTWPWLVAIYTFTGPTLGYRCGGSLITERMVLTTAHCFFRRSGGIRLKARDVVMFLGKYDLRKLDEEGGKIIYPDSLIIHPEYNFHNPDADIAVLVAPEVIEFTRFIRPICLWNISLTENVIDRVGVVAGWGMDEVGNAFSDLPKRVRVPVVSNSVCRNSSQQYLFLTSDRTLCVGWRNGTDGVCQGDSGGGYAFDNSGKWYLRGLVSTSPSSGQGTCNLNEYVVFVDILKFIDWIRSHDQKA